jgi:dolichol-phosphate mannosyltransferase
MGDPALHKVHVILPAYNEEGALPSLLQRLGSFAGDQQLDVVAWIVDDGSTDGTARVAESGFSGLETKLISHSVNLGLGQAVHTGIREVVVAAAPDDVAVIMDADDTHDVEVIGAMLDRIEHGADLVIASRFVPGGDDSTAPAFRRFLSRGAAWVFGLVMPIRGVHDFTSGYRAYRMSLLSRAVDHWGERIVEEHGFACMVELLLKLRYCHPVVEEVPLVLRYDRKQGASKLKINRTIVQYVRLAVRDRLAPPPYREL